MRCHPCVPILASRRVRGQPWKHGWSQVSGRARPGGPEGEDCTATASFHECLGLCHPPGLVLVNPNPNPNPVPQ